MQSWSTGMGRPVGAVVSLSTLWALATIWYADRLSPSWRRRSADESQAIFTRVGLTDPFWQLR